MSVVTILLPLALLLAFGFLGLYLWAVSNDQFADGDTPALRMLLDDDKDDLIRKAPPVCDVPSGPPTSPSGPARRSV